MGVVVLVGTAKGVVILQSDDARSTWDDSGLQLKGWLVTTATRDATGRTYVGVTHDVYGAAVLASDDLSEWQQLDGAPRYAQGLKGNAMHNRIIGAMDPMGQYEGDGRFVDQIWKLHASGDVLYAGVSEAGLFKSQDHGKTWQGVEGFNEHPTRADWGPGFGGLCAHTVLVDERNPDRIWVGVSSSGAFRSDDGGTTWEPKNDGVAAAEGFCVHSMAHDPQNANVIYRQDHRGVYRTDDGGDQWKVIENGLPESILSDEHRCTFGFAVQMDPKSGNVYTLPIESDGFRFPHDGKLSVYRTSNGGDQWEALREGLPDDCYSNVLRGAMSLDALDPCGVYFGTTSGSVYASSDRGESWRLLLSNLPKVLSVDAFVV
jgi:hypothetical protein